MKKILYSEWFSRLIDSLLPVFATLGALLVGAVMLLFLKVNPIEAYKALWDGAFGSSNAFADTDNGSCPARNRTAANYP
jgi:simple sugar transport system permease protein